MDTVDIQIVLNIFVLAFLTWACLFCLIMAVYQFAQAWKRYMWWSKIREVFRKKTSNERIIADACRRGVPGFGIREWGAAIHQVCPHCEKDQYQANDSLFVTQQLAFERVEYKFLQCEHCRKEFLGVNPQPTDVQPIISGKAGWC